MREIKFRAFDTEKGEMYTPTFEAYKGQLFELMVSFSGDLLAHTLSGVEHQSKWPDRFKLMQYTGLKDKNGREIYEGDILKASQPIEGYIAQATTCRVYWLEDQFQWWITDGTDDPIVGVDYDLSYLRCFSVYEVIGNLYENPDLLERKDHA